MDVADVVLSRHSEPGRAASPPSRAWIQGLNPLADLIEFFLGETRRLYEIRLVFQLGIDGIAARFGRRADERSVSLVDRDGDEKNCVARGSYVPERDEVGPAPVIADVDNMAR